MIIRFLFAVFVLWNASCATNDSELQTARMVEPGLYTYTFGYQYLAEHDDDVWEKIRKNDFSGDYNAANVSTGVNFLMRRGITENFDLALNTSLGKTSFEGRFALFNGTRFASAAGAKLVLPTFAIEVPTLYRYKLVWYNSYELLPNFAVYASPHIEWKPWGGRRLEYWGLSTGMVIGKDSGIVAEASYARATKGEDPLSYQQFIIGYTRGLDRLRGRLQYDPMSSMIKILPSFGMSVFPTPSLGLIGRYLSGGIFDYELGVDLGIGPIPDIGETKIGLMTSRLFAFRALYEFHKLQSVKFGLARKEIRGDFDLERGWHSLQTVNHGLELSWEQAFSEWKVSWFGVYVPLLFLPHSHRYTSSGYSQTPSEGMQSLVDRFERGVSYSLLNVHKEF